MKGWDTKRTRLHVYAVWHGQDGGIRLERDVNFVGEQVDTVEGHPSCGRSHQFLVGCIRSAAGEVERQVTAVPNESSKDAVQPSPFTTRRAVTQCVHLSKQEVEGYIIMRYTRESITSNQRFRASVAVDDPHGRSGYAGVTRGRMYDRRTHPRPMLLPNESAASSASARAARPLPYSILLSHSSSGATWRIQRDRARKEFLRVFGVVVCFILGVNVSTGLPTISHNAVEVVTHVRRD